MRVLVAAWFIIGFLGLLVSILLPFGSAVYVLFFVLGETLMTLAIAVLAWDLRREPAVRAACKCLCPWCVRGFHRICPTGCKGT